VQARDLRHKASAETFATRLRTETSQRVDAIFDPAGGLYKIPQRFRRSAPRSRPQSTIAGGYGKDMMVAPSDRSAVREAASDRRRRGDRSTIAANRSS
jgi:hypothetical protein